MVMPDGTSALVVFELVERDGHIIARAVYAEKIDVRSVPEQKVLLLDGEVVCTDVLPVKSFYTNYVSPYFKDFSFVMSQPTRAPSFC